MTPTEWNTWGAFILLGVPLVTVFSGPFGWCAMWILAGVAMLALHPAFAITIGVVIVLRRPLRWLAEGALAGFGAGLGLRAAGTFGRLSRPPRRERMQRYRRPPIGYSPNDSFDDEWPSNLEGRE
jgi:hypothetical protein